MIELIHHLQQMPWFIDTYVFFARQHGFLTGANCALSFVAALCFLRFYRKTGDRLFIFFSAAFSIMGINRLIFTIIASPDNEPTILYIIRLAAYLLILWAIIDKNRPPRRPS